MTENQTDSKVKFRYYITDIGEGSIKGTNSEDVALDYSHSDDYFIVDTQTNEQIYAGNREQIEEMK